MADTPLCGAPAASNLTLDATAWQAAMEAWRTAEAAEEAHYKALRAAVEGQGGEAPAAIREEADRLYWATHATLWTLMDMPAPSAEALRWKLQYLFADDGSGSMVGWSNEAIAQARTDIDRLLLGEAV